MKTNRIVGFTVFATLLLIVLLIIAWKGVLSPSSFYNELRAYDLYAKALQHDLQFVHGSPYCKVGNVTTEVFTLHPNSDSSPFALAGVVSGDIVFDDFRINGFYMLLEQFRGTVFRFRVASGGDGPELRVRPHKIIEIHVPKRK